MTWLSQLRFAFRSLARAPLATALGALSLAIGLAAAITAASLAETLLLAPLPGVEAGDELVKIETTDATGEPAAGLSHPAYRALASAVATLTGTAAFSDHVLAFRAEGETEALLGQTVSASYFTVLGARPAAGRFFLPQEDGSPGAHPVAVLSHAYWQRRFGGDPAAVGRRVSINGSPFTVVGIAGPGFRGAFRGFRFDVWTPLAMAGSVEPRERLDDWSSPWLEVIGRRAPGSTREQVAAELSSLAPRLADPTLAERRALGFAVRTVTGLDDELRGGAIGLVAVLMSVALLVLVVASANLASLQLVRALGRGRELAVRQAVGASRRQLLGQLLAESVGLGLLGGAGGLLLAAWASEALSLFQPPPPFAIDLHLGLGPRVLAFALAASLATGLAVGLGPAFQASRLSFGAVLREAAGGGRRQARLRGALVVAQVAFSLVLLIAAGLLLRTLASAARLDPGFDPEGVDVALLDAGLLRLDGAASREIFRQLVEAAEALPGVEAVSLVDRPPLALGGPGRRQVNVPGYPTVLGPAAGEEALSIAAAVVGPGYFELMRTPLAWGRGFEAADHEGAPAVAVVNETMARRFWAPKNGAGDDAVGRSFVLDGQAVTVVGVARDGKYRNLGEEPRPFFFLPFAQQPQPRMHLLVRRAAAAEVGPAVAAAVERLAPDLPIVLSTPLRRLIGLSLLPQRIAGAAAGVLGAVGLLLASLGVYGSVASTVRQRRRELGIHLALGAERHEVVGLVIKEGVLLAAAGVLLGTLAALGTLRFARGLLFGISASDPFTYVAVAALLAVATLVASYLPARHAARLDPISALRSE